MEGLVFSAKATTEHGTAHKPPDKGGGDHHTDKQQKVSFRDMVTGMKEPLVSRPKVDLLKEKLASIKYEDDNPLKPMVILEDEVVDQLCAPWHDALVVKLLGKTLGFQTMRDRLARVWKLQSGFELMDIDHGYYMVKFDMEGDRTKVMEEGPWMVFDHYLTVQTWTPEFLSPKAKIEKTMVWVRFPGLNLLFYDESILLVLASTIGKPIRVDSNTLDVRRGRFARVCVELDLTKPVVGKVWLRGHWYHVEYEGLHRLCTSCGCYGHVTRQCQAARTQPPSPETVVQHPNGTTMQGDGGGQKAAQGDKDTTSVGKPSHQQPKSAPHTQDPIHGDWLIVKKKNGKNRGNIPFKNNNDMRDKVIIGNDGKKVKFYTPSGPSSSNVFGKQNSSNVGGTAREHRRPNKAPNKRMRQEANTTPDKDPNMEKSRNNTPAIKAPSEVKQASGPVIYDLGHGAKSTVHMQEVAHNRFVLLHDDDANGMDTMHEDDAMGDPSKVPCDGDTILVPETQMVDEHMAT